MLVVSGLTSPQLSHTHRMLPYELLWVTFALLVVRVRCSNEFVDSKFPSEFGLDKETEFYWDNLKGYIAGIRVHAAGEESDSDSDSDSDSNWILGQFLSLDNHQSNHILLFSLHLKRFLNSRLSPEPRCSDGDSDSDDDDDDSNSSCTAYANNGSAYFGGGLAVYSNGTQLPVGTGYELHLLWTDSKGYDDIDDDTTQEVSPGFSIVANRPGGGDSKNSKAEKAGIAIGVILVVVILVLLLFWYWRRERRRNKRRNKRRKAEKDVEKDRDDEGWTSAPKQDHGMKQGMLEGWTTANTSGKPGPTTSGIRRNGTGGEGRLYLDDKAELASDSTTQQLVGPHGTNATSSKTGLLATRTHVAPVELPTEPLREENATRYLGTVGPMFVYDPRPSYALWSPASPNAEPIPVSPMSPMGNDVATPDVLDSTVSPVSPITRKPVGGHERVTPVEQQQQTIGRGWSR